MNSSSMPKAPNAFGRVGVRCVIAVVAAAGALLLRGALERGLGATLPPFIVFFPTIMAVAIWAGLWPGLVATAAAIVLTDYFILGPLGSLTIANPADAISLALFAFMGIVISWMAERYRRGQQQLATAEKELASRDSEEQFRTLANAIPQLCWMANADGWIYWYNQRWYDYTGTTPKQMEGWGWQSVHDPKTLPNVLERWKASIATGGPFEMVFPLLGADGVFRPFLTRVMPAKDADGKIVHWFGTNTDISEQQKAEETLRESEERYRRLFDKPLTAAKPSVLPVSTRALVGVAVAVLAVNAGLAYWSITRLIENDRWVSHTYQAIGGLERVVSLLKDAETGNRGYLLAGTANYLEPYSTAVNKLQAQVVAAQQLTADNPLQRQSFPELEQKINRRMALLEQGIDLRRQGITGPAQIALQDTGKHEMDGIRTLVRSMEDEEYRLLAERRTDSVRSAWTSELTLLLASVLAIAFLLFIARVLYREQRLRDISDEVAKRFRSLFEYAPVGIKQVALDGRLLTANPALCRMLDYSESELLAKTFEELTHPDDRERERQQLDAVLRGQREYVHIDLRYLRRDGSPVEVALATSIVKNSAGEALYRICVVQDISARKRAEVESRAREQRLRLAADAAQLGIFEWTVPTDTAVWENQRMYEIFGIPEATDPVNRDLFVRENLHPEDLPRFTRELEESMQPGALFRGAYRIRRVNDGQWRWVQYFAKFELTPDSKPLRLVGVLQDITERRQAEEAVRQSLERLKKVLEVETVGVMFWDLNTGCMVDANDAFLKLMGYSRSQVEAGELNWQTLTPPEYIDMSRAEVEKFLVTGRVGPYEKEYFCKDGTRRWLLFAGSSLGNNQCVEFCVDIADRKQAEQALREVNEQLEDRVRRRTSELETMNKEAAAFSYSVSHDLRGPLRTMDGFSQALLEDHAAHLDEKGRHYLERIRTAAQRMGALIDALLQLSRLTRAEMETKPVRSVRSRRAGH